MTWLLTGGSGQLSSALAELLEVAGKSFVPLSRNELDISNELSIEKIVLVRPSLIVNCAAFTAVDKAESDPVSAFSVNSTGAANVAVAAKELEVPLIHISTDYVFSGVGNLPWRVDSETLPTTQYGKSKLAGERLVQEIYPEGSWILRTAWLYSAHGKNFAKTMIRKAISEQSEVRVVNDQVGQPTSALDVAHRIIEIEDFSISPGVYHATNSGRATWFEFATEIFQQCGTSTDRVVPVSSSEYPMPAKRPRFSVLDHSNWEAVGASNLQSWRCALNEVYPIMRRQVEKELKDG